MNKLSTIRSIMNEHEANYSTIIGADAYNRMMSEEHLYIAEADIAICSISRRYTKSKECSSEVLEIGCGPARITPLLAKIPNTHVTGLDFDAGWMSAARKTLHEHKAAADLVCADILTYTHAKPIDIAISQGSHHHIQKGKPTKQYLENIRNQLSPGGIYIVSDEMLPYYASEQERYVRLCIWYAHIINNALESGHEELAVAEMETLLDDLFEGSGDLPIKSEFQMDLVRTAVPIIAHHALIDDLPATERESELMLKNLWESQTNHSPTPAPPSRGDYKICFSVFEKEIQDAGFQIREAKTIGPIETIGGFGIFTLEVSN